MRIIGLILLVVSLNVSASLKDLGKELLSSNQDIQNQILDKQNQDLELEKYLGVTDWELAFATQFSDSNLVGTRFNTERILISGETLTLSSNLPVGMNFSLESGLTHYDYTRGGTFFNQLDSQKFYEFYSTASLGIDLWKDFLGQRYRAGKKSSELGVKNAQIQLDQQTAGKLLELGQNYLNYYSANMVKVLGKESLKRAKSRYKSTLRKFKDGASPRIDLYQAEASVLNQEEFNYTSQVDELRAKEKLDQLVHRKVENLSFDGNNVQKITLSKRVRGKLANNYDLKLLANALDLAKTNLDVAQKSDGLDINLLLQYKTNAVDANSSQTIKDGFFASDRDEKVVSLNVTIPLEDNVNYSTTQQNRLALLKAKNSLAANKKNLELAFNNLDQMIELLEKQFSNAKKKVITNKKALKEANRLYNLGKRDFEFVLNAEDALINAERSLVTIYSNYEKLVATEAYMSGKMNSYIDNYRY